MADPSKTKVAGKAKASGTMSGGAGGRTEGMSFKIVVSSLPKAGMPVRFAARPEELAGLAAFLGIPSVERMEADVLVARWNADGVRISGRLEAAVVQTDVVTLEPLAQTVAEEVDLVFVPEHSRLARVGTVTDGELHLDPEGDDIPDTFSGDRIDLGAVLTEVLALGLDPYPRAGGATFEEVDTDPRPDEGRISPFATLRKLKPDEG